jgi:hypothetical protein
MPQVYLGRKPPPPLDYRFTLDVSFEDLAWRKAPRFVKRLCDKIAQDHVRADRHPRSKVSNRAEKI